MVEVARAKGRLYMYKTRVARSCVMHVPVLIAEILGLKPGDRLDVTVRLVMDEDGRMSMVVEIG